MRKHQHGTAYRYGGLSCGCVRGLTGPEVTNGEAACIAKPVFPPKRENGPCEPNTRPILWVALPGANVKPHRCCDGPAPSPPGSLGLPELPEVQGPCHEEEKPLAPSTLSQAGTQEGQPPAAAFSPKGDPFVWEF